MDSPKWACARCSEFSHELFYCSECWKTVCSNCYDEFVGVCNDCVKRLFKGSEDSQGASSSFGPLMCPTCKIAPIITPDGTICCPKCGAVFEVRSVLLEQNPGSEVEDETTEEDQTWRDVGLPDITEDELPDGYEDITHPGGDDDYDTE